MATAIIRTYTPDGFVIAADGLTTNSEDLRPVTETAQKIFSASHKNAVMALSMNGHLMFTPHRSSEVLLDLQLEARRTIAELASTSFPDPQQYGLRLSFHLTNEIERVKREGGISPLETGKRKSGESYDRIAGVFLDGYWDGKPFTLSIRLSHVDQTMNKPRIEDYVFPLPPDEAITKASGSALLVEALLNNSTDERFAKYRVNNPLNLGSMILRSRLFIEAHGDPVAIALDEDFCRLVGGRTHIATLTPWDEFQWVPGDEPKDTHPVGVIS